MDGVGTPIIGRPRPLPGHDTPNPAYHPHTLNYEEPLITVNSDDGAIATAKYWVQLYYYIYTTGKVDEYKKLCPGNGSIATKPVEDATRNQSEGGWIAPVTLKFTAAFRRSDFKNDVVIQVDFDREGVNHYDSDGRIEYHPKQSRYAGVKLEYNGSQWIVKEAFNRED